METEAQKEIVAKILPSLTAEEVDQFLTYLEFREAAIGSILVSQGETDRDLYLLLNGAYSVFSKFRVNLTSVAMNTANFPGPGLLGEVNLVLDSTRTATVVAREACAYLYLSKDAFDRMTAEAPQIGIMIVTTVASIIHGRSENTRRVMYTNLISESPSVPVGISRIGRWMGKWTRVSDDISTKLFGDFEGENFNS